MRRKLVFALLLPHFLNREVDYYGFDSISLHRLVIAFNEYTRYIYDLSQREHVSERVVEVLGLSLADYLKYIIGI